MILSALSIEECQSPATDVGVEGLGRAARHPVRRRFPDPQESLSIMKITPLNDRVLVKRVEAKESMKGGIIIPDTAKEKPQEGEVVAVGEGKLDEKGHRIKMQVKKGDRVLFAKYAGSDVKINEDECLILREDDILGIIA